MAELTTADCWVWGGTLYRNGYACFFDGDRNVLAHRWIYKRLAGPIPPGLEIDHLCNVRACVNPTHMRLVTHDENKRREVARRTHCLNGHALTKENVYIYRGYRRCRECHRRSSRDYERRKA